MKTKIGILIFVLTTCFFNLEAQRVVTTTRAMSNDISDNLDLDAVASIFGESKDLEDFEYRLNDPELRISNLDLNRDGYVDYLRVVESTDERGSLVVIQAVLDRDVYQDVATIEIERINGGNCRVQVVGNAYIYGANFIIEPVYVRPPVIFSFFWGPRYHVWHSPYYWGYYPRWYYRYRPYPTIRYQRNVYVNINVHNTYHRTTTRNTYFSGDRYNHVYRNDYANRHPDRSFERRNPGMTNRNELGDRRPDRFQEPRRSTSAPGQSRVRTNSPNDGSGRVESRQAPREYRRPATTEPSGRPQNQEYNRNNQIPKREYNRSAQPQQREYDRSNQVQQKREYDRGSYEKRSVTTPDRSSQRVEPANRGSVSREKSSTVTRSDRSGKEVKQRSSSSRKPDSTSGKSEKKEPARERRRGE
jgi:hypothetical protein